uniref:Uncharacterized protein n=1 Tax=Anopheles funestus TaxID=62324 RepID=A0A182S2T6_ANOFN
MLSVGIRASKNWRILFVNSCPNSFCSKSSNSSLHAMGSNSKLFAPYPFEYQSNALGDLFLGVRTVCLKYALNTKTLSLH